MAQRNCDHCNTPFQIRPQGQHAKFCSSKCRIAHFKQVAKQRKLDQTSLTFYIGKVRVQINDLAPDTDREALQASIIASLPSDYIAKADMLELPEGAEPVHTIVNL